MLPNLQYFNFLQFTTAKSWEGDQQLKDPLNSKVGGLVCSIPYATACAFFHLHGASIINIYT